MKKSSLFLWGSLFIAFVSVLLVPHRALGETSVEFNIDGANYEVFVSDSRPSVDDRLEADVRVSLTTPELELEVQGIATASSEATLVASSLLAIAIMSDSVEAFEGETIELESLDLSFTVTTVISDQDKFLSFTDKEVLIAALVSIAAIAALGGIGDSLTSQFANVSDELLETDPVFASCAQNRGRLRVTVETVIIDNNQFRRVFVKDEGDQPVEGAHVTAIFPNHTNPGADQDILITNRTDASGGANFAGAPFPERTNFYAVATNGQDTGGVVCRLETPS